MKFDLPMIQFSKEEKEIWLNLSKLAKNPDAAVEFQTNADQLFALRESGVSLSSISAEMLSLESLSEQMQYAS